MNSIKTKILLFIILSIPLKALSQEFTYQGINYTTAGMPEGECATVAGYASANRSYAGTENVTGALVIPYFAITPGGTPYKVTKISDFSFWSINDNGNNITSVVIPNSVSWIGDRAFNSNPVSKFVIGSGVNHIDYGGLFNNSDHCEAYILSPSAPFVYAGHCTPQGEIDVLHIPFNCKTAYSDTYWDGYNGKDKNIWTIVDDADIVISDDIIYQYDPVEGDSAIVIGTNNPELKNVTIKPSITTILDKTIPITEIGARAFYKNESVQNVNIGNGIKTIGEEAFAWCSNIETLSFGSTVKEIKKAAFARIDKLKRVGLPSSVEIIGYEAFSSGQSLEYVMLGKGLKKIENYAFNGCPNLSEVEVEDLSAWCSVDLSGETSNPMFFSHSFSIRGKKQSTLKIPYGVKFIKPYTFTYCSDINKLELSETVERIGRESFSRSGLEKLENTMNVERIDMYAFLKCEKLETVSLSEKMKVIDQGAFSGCSSLNTFSVEGKLSSVGISAFSGCESLTMINVGGGLGNVWHGAFSGCTSLVKVNTGSISGWCDQTFKDEKSNPLYYAKKLYLNSVEISDLNIDDNVKSINDFAFINCTSLQTVNTGDGVETIGKNAFDGCSGLQELSMGKAVSTIGDNAFNGASNLSSIYFGKNVSEIGSGIFNGCINIRKIEALMNPAPLQTEACFEDIAYSNATLYVSPASYSIYRITAPWSGFRKIREFEIAMDESSLGISGDRKTLNVGDKFEIKVTTEPASMKNELVWTSSNPEVATVDEKGVVEALHKGTADITISAKEVARIIHIAVESPVKSIKLNSSDEIITQGENIQIIAIIMPEDADDPSIEWSSSNPDIASVYRLDKNSCVVEGKSTGPAVITATTSNGLTAECKIEVILPATAIAIDYSASGIEGDELSMVPGEKREIKVVIYPVGSTDRLFWSSSNQNVATVNDGVVDAISNGKSLITVETESGKKAEITVNIGSSSIEDILSDSDAVDMKIYDLQGICIYRKASAKELQSLDAGVYIIRYDGKTKKIVVR